MSDVLTSLAPGAPVDLQFSALRSVLRSSYATGRTSAAVLRAVLALAASPEAPTAARVLCYEIAWTSVAAADAGSYARLLALARVDCLHGDHPDLTLAALATISSAPPRYAPMLLGGGEDTERAMVDAMGGDAPPHVRAASITAFARVRVCEARREAARARVCTGNSSPKWLVCAQATHGWLGARV